MLVREKNGIVNIEYRLIDQRVTAANDAYPVKTLSHLLIAILHIENQVQLHDIHERVEEFLHRHEHQVVSISNQLIQAGCSDAPNDTLCRSKDCTLCKKASLSRSSKANNKRKSKTL